MRIGAKIVLVAICGAMTVGLTGCATMKNIGDSLAFWKKSPPKDQFAVTPKPSSNFNPSGVPGPTGSGQQFAGNRPGSYPLGGSGNGGFGRTPSTGNGSFAGSGTRTPYGSQMPAQSTYPGENRGLGSSSVPSSPAARTAENVPYGRSGAGSRYDGNGFGGNGFGGSMPPSTPKANSPTPSSRFRDSGNGFQANPSTNTYSGSPSPGSSFSTSSGSTGFSTPAVSGPTTSSPASSSVPATSPRGSGFSAPPSSSNPARSGGFQGGASPAYPSGAPASGGQAPSSKSGPSAEDNWKQYPSTRYPGFGDSSFSPSSSTPANSSGGFAGKNVPASANMTPPPSLPSTVLEKKGSYSPGSIGNVGKASNAGFETGSQQDSAPSGTRIPSSTDLYTPQ